MSAHCCSPAGANDHAAKPAHAADLLRGDAELAECPVMPGSMVDPAQAEAAGLFRDHEGERYWFCCAACGPLFDADPARYAVTA